MNKGEGGPMSSTLALGLDIGGTSTRAIVVSLNGDRLGTGRADGANITSHAPEKAMAAVAAALTEALVDVDPADVGGAVVGTAGDRNFTVPAIADAFQRTWESAGLTCEYEIVSDVAVAFAAGTPSGEGTLLLSGTGAAAARVENRHTTHIVDGHGWLLGDRGSGFWMGREAVRVVLDTFDRAEEFGPLARAVLVRMLGDASPPMVRESSAELVRRVHARPPVALSELAPLVSEHADVDPEAARILAGAADLLADAASLVRELEDSSPIVLAGGLLIADTPLSRLVRPRLEKLWPDARITRALDGAAGAAWLAAVRAGELDDAARDDLHGRILGPPNAAP